MIEPRIVIEAGDTPSSSVSRQPVGRTLFNEVGRYKFQLIGGSNTRGYDTGSNYIGYIDVDSDPETYNSSAMTYYAAGTVRKAFLYLPQSYRGTVTTTRSETYILGSKGNKFYFDDGYQDAYYDITDFIKEQGEGQYWGKNIDSERSTPFNYDNCANWQIVIIEENLSFNYRQMILLGYNTQMQNNNLTLPVSAVDLYTPETEVSGQFLITATGGNSRYNGERVALRAKASGTVLKETIWSDGARPANNFLTAVLR